MKKVLAVLLAALMAFGVCCLGAAAEDEPAAEPTYNMANGTLTSIKIRDGEVIVLKAGDVIRMTEITGKTTNGLKRLEVRYYPDAASIKTSTVTNLDWKNNVVPKYNLDSTKWELKEGQTVDSLLAKSPNYFKSFYTFSEHEKGESPEVTILGLNGENAFARDSANVDRGEGPIDFALADATFVGWALYNVKWTASKNDLGTIEVYALWDRGAAPEKPTEPDNPQPGEPVEYDTPIQASLAKVQAFIKQIAGYVLTVPAAIVTALPNWMNGLIRSWLYKLFGIEA